MKRSTIELASVAAALASQAGIASLVWFDAHATASDTLEASTGDFSAFLWDLNETSKLPGKIKAGSPWEPVRLALLSGLGIEPKDAAKNGRACRAMGALRKAAESGGKVTYAEALSGLNALDAEKKRTARKAKAEKAAGAADAEPTDADADTSEQPKEGVTEKGKFRSLTIRSDAGAAEAFALLSAFAEQFGLSITLAE